VFPKVKQNSCRFFFQTLTKRFSYSLFFPLLILFSCHRHKDIQNSTVYQTAADTVKSSLIPDDMQVTVSEDMLNKSLKALGPISGKEPFDIFILKDTFTWILIDPYLKLHNGKADFGTQVKIVAGNFTYTTTSVGNVDIWYDRKKNLINVQIRHCIVDVYTKFFGIKHHIADYDIANQFTDPFTFDGPSATSSEMDMEMPDGSIRKLYMTTTDCDLSVQEKKIVVPCEVAFSLIPPGN
jgi:hypothetical protein